MNLSRLLLVSALLMTACAGLPSPSHKKYSFPKDTAFTDDPPPGRKFKILGQVKTKVDFNSVLTAENDDTHLCKNYFNKAIQDLVKRARDQGGDAVIQVRSVVQMIDGKQETYKDAQCADEGGEGQVLARGTAIQWLPNPEDN